MAIERLRTLKDALRYITLKRDKDHIMVTEQKQYLHC